jgi:hypothetical protein
MLIVLMVRIYQAWPSVAVGLATSDTPQLSTCLPTPLHAILVKSHVTHDMDCGLQATLHVNLGGIESPSLGGSDLEQSARERPQVKNTTLASTPATCLQPVLGQYYIYSGAREDVWGYQLTSVFFLTVEGLQCPHSVGQVDY